MAIEEAIANTGGTRRFGEKRRAIVNAASGLINEVGLQATTLSAVARAIGLNATSVTYYYPRKDELAIAVYSDTIARMEAMAAEAAREPTPAARLRRYLALHVALRTRIRRGERGLLTTLSEVRTLDHAMRAPLLDHYRRMVDSVRGFFGTPADDAGFARATVYAHSLVEAMLWWPVWSRRYSSRDFPRVEARMFDILAHGIPAAHGRWAPQRLAGGDWRTADGADDAQTSRTEFLRAATELINQRGYRGASVNRIADALNVTKGSFYHHHDAKDDLVLACFQRSYDRLSSVQLAGEALETDYWTRVASTLAELVDLQFTDPMPLLRTTALQALDAGHRADVVTRSNRLARRFAGMLIDGIADGSVRAIDPLIASQLIMSTLNGANEARSWAARFDTTQDAVAAYLRPLTHGLLDDDAA